MNMTPLDSLKRDSLFEALKIIPPPAILRRAIQKIPAIKQIRWGIRNGRITEQTFRDFVAAKMAAFRCGEPFKDDIVLAALAVAVESSSKVYAEELLFDLARLRLAEMPVSSRVARECLKARCVKPKIELRRFQFAVRNRLHGKLLARSASRQTARKHVPRTEYATGGV